MKVTDEMVVRALDVVARATTEAPWPGENELRRMPVEASDPHVALLRAALEAALAAVPEPSEQAETVADGYADMVRQQQERIAELEAKLAAVREPPSGDERQREAEAIVRYGDEQHAAGVELGWRQALIGVEDFAAAHPGATAWDCAAELRKQFDSSLDGERAKEGT